MIDDSVNDFSHNNFVQNITVLPYVLLIQRKMNRKKIIFQGKEEAFVYYASIYRN